MGRQAKVPPAEEGVPGATAAAASGQRRRRRRTAAAGAGLTERERYAGHSSEWFAKQLATRQRREEELSRVVRRLSELVAAGVPKAGGSDRARSPLREEGAQRSRSSTPRSCTGGQSPDGQASGGTVVGPGEGSGEPTAPGSTQGGKVETPVSGMSVEEWRAEHSRLVAARAALGEGGRAGEARAAILGAISDLGPEPALPPKTVSPWATLQKARRLTTKCTKRLDAARAAHAEAVSAAQAAKDRLLEAESKLSRATSEENEAKTQEGAALRALQATRSTEEPASAQLGSLMAELSVPGVAEDERVATAVEGLRAALGQRARRATPAPALAEGAAPAAGVPKRPPWADNDAVDACAGSGDEFDDSFADVIKRGCPDDELNACGARDADSPGDHSWETKRSRCRRASSEHRARARSVDDAAARHAGSSRSPCRGNAPAVAEVRRAVDTVKVAVAAPAFSAALPSACGQLVDALQGNAAVGVSSIPQHPVFVAAGGRIHSKC